MAAIRHMAADSYGRNPQMTPVLSRVKQAGVKMARWPGKPCRATNDVTLSGAFNAPCQPAELGMIGLFVIISVDNDYFAIVVTP